VSIDKRDKEKFVISIYDVENLNVVHEYETQRFRKENWPYLRFTEDDELCFKNIKSNSIEIMSSEKKFEVIKRLETPNFDFFTICPKRDNLLIVCISAEKIIGYSKTESRVEVYKYGELDKGPYITKVVDKAHEIAPIFSPTGQNLLLWAQTTHDETGKSYYGEHALYYLDMNKKDFKRVPLYKGPIHDVAWNPNGLEFIVISGFMPAASVLFDNLCNPKFEFGKHHRNTVKWSPLSRFVCLAGFGNLSGEMEIWDIYNFKQVGTCKSNSAVFCSWAPDGRRILTGVLNPRLRVDNGYKIFKYNGVLLNSVDFSQSELYEVMWRPGKYMDRPASPDSDKQAALAKTDTRPKRIFKPQGSGAFASMLKVNKQTSGPRQLLPNERFDNDIDSPLMPVEEKKDDSNKKKKRIRKKKDKLAGEKEEDDNENDKNDDT